MKHKYHKQSLTPLLAAVLATLAPWAAQAAGALPDTGAILQHPV